MTIHIQNQQKQIKIETRKARQSLLKILDSLDCSDMEVSVTFVDDSTIQDTNRQYLGRDNPTNVISFSMQEGEFGNINPSLLGDIIISVETALRDAEKGGLSLEDEIDYLMIHGTLHLLGYDHEESPSDAEIMKAKEREIFLALRGYEIE